MWHVSNLSWAIAPSAFHVCGVVLAALILLLSFTFVDEKFSALINRWLFHTPDYRILGRELAERLRQSPSETAFIATAENAVGEALESSQARIAALNGSSKAPPGLLDGEIVEVNEADTLVPIATA